MIPFFFLQLLKIVNTMRITRAAISFVLIKLYTKLYFRRQYLTIDWKKINIFYVRK